MNISIYQVVVVVIAIVMLYQGVRNFVTRKPGQTFLKLFIRVLVWGGMLLIAIYPNFTEVFAKMLGFKENMNAVIITGFFLVFLIIFKLLSAIESIEQKLTELTRKEALTHLSELKADEKVEKNQDS